jgi:hypothetical protein
MFPGYILKHLPKRLGIPYFRRTYRRSRKTAAMAELDDFIASGNVVGIQTSAYFTPYFPPEMRFQFNAHNIIVVAKAGDRYIVSDPVFDHLVNIGARDLQKARFALGFSAPKGLVHYPLSIPSGIDLPGAVRTALKKTVRNMLHAPLSYVGVKGMACLARRIETLPSRYDPRYRRLFLGNIVRMQEEIGTGGGGFRFMYAAFLQEAGDILALPALERAADRMTAVGDRWRDFALACAKVVKGKADDSDLLPVAAKLRSCMEDEKETYRLVSRLLHDA